MTFALRDPATIHSNFAETFNAMARAFPDGLEEDQFAALFAVIYGLDQHSARSTALLISTCFDVEYGYAYMNAVYSSEAVASEEIDRMLDRLNHCGYQFSTVEESQLHKLGDVSV
jgi:hypothetical protein